MGALRDSRCDSPEGVTRFVADTLRRFAAGAAQSDDITMLALQCVQAPAAPVQPPEDRAASAT